MNTKMILLKLFYIVLGSPVLLSFVNSVAETREDVFEFREPDYENNLELFGNLSYTEALLKQQQLEHFTDNKMSLKSVENDLFSSKLNNYSVPLYTRPCILIGFLNSIFQEIPTFGDIPVDVILKILFDYEPVMSRYIARLKQLISFMVEMDCGLMEVLSTHGPFATVITSKFQSQLLINRRFDSFKRFLQIKSIFLNYELHFIYL